MQVSLWLLFFVALLWCIEYALHAVRFSGGTFSEFELDRRADDGDLEAVRLRDRQRILPRLQTLQQVIEAVLVVLAIALTISAFGWVVGTVVAAMLCLLRDRLARFAPIVRFSQWLRASYEAPLLEAVGEWRWLDWLQGVTELSSPDRVIGSREELYHIIEQSSAILGSEELKRLGASKLFDTKLVRDVMTPISVVDTTHVNDALGPLVLDDLHKTGHSRFPVVDGDIHHVVGILYLHDIINLKSAKPTVKEAMDARVHYIHENQSLEHALNGFLKSHRHLFVVVNDYRETVGVLTLEDVLEALLGRKIIDEFDRYDDLRAVAESNPRKNNVPKGKTDI